MQLSNKTYYKLLIKSINNVPTIPTIRTHQDTFAIFGEGLLSIEYKGILSIVPIPKSTEQR